jgi:hypothetical protein
MSSETAANSRAGLGLLHAQSRVLDALASCSPLEGTAETLMQQLGISAGAFRLALLDLVAGGWIFTHTTREGVLTIGRERRLHDQGPPEHAERRRPDQRQKTSRWERHEIALHA